MTAPTNDTKLEVLNDHYKETYNNLQEFRKLRERLMAFIIATIALMSFQVFSPTQAGNAIGQFVASQLDLQSSIDTSFLGSIIWFCLLAFVVRYFQTVIHIERQYDYLHNLENLLSKHYDGNAFTREGKSYLKKYPLFSNWAHFLYTTIFPALLIIVVVIKTANEIKIVSHVSALLIFNSLIALFILVSIVLYLMLIHFKK